MKLFIKTFTNEFGNKILIMINDVPARKSVQITMRGPMSDTTNEMTYAEAGELRDALRKITI